MPGIQLNQPGGAGIINAGGASAAATGQALPGVRGYLTFVGTTTTWTWGLAVPLGSTSSLRYANTKTPDFAPDLDGVSGYVVTFTDSAANVYTLTLGCGKQHVAAGADGSQDFVDSIATLRNRLPASTNEVIAVRCTASVGDNGGGDFIWSPSNVAADDGGTVIAVAGMITGRWVRISLATVTPSMFGAAGDNTGNDAPAIMAALAYGYATGSSVDILPGTYRCTTAITWPVTTDYGICVRGAGPNKTILSFVNATHGIDFDATVPNNVQIQDLSIRGPNTFGGTSLAAVTVASATDVVTEVAHGRSNGSLVAFATTAGGISKYAWYFVRNKTTDGYQISLTSAGAIVNITADGPNTVGTIVGTANHGMYLHNLTQEIAHFQLSNVKISNFGGGGFTLPYTEAIGDLFTSAFVHVEVDNCGGHAISFRASNTVELTGCYVHGVPMYGFAGYRAYTGKPVFIGCNGFDSGPGIVGYLLGEDVANEGVANSVYAQFIGCNIEQFTLGGVWGRANSVFGTISTVWLAPSATVMTNMGVSGATVAPIRLDATQSQSGRFDQLSQILTNGVAYSHGGAAIQSFGSPFIVEGNGILSGGANITQWTDHINADAVHDLVCMGSHNDNDDGAYALRISRLIARRDNLVVTSAIGFDVQNLQAATAGVPVQRSPISILTGMAWDTFLTASVRSSMGWQVRPVSGNPPTVEYHLVKEMGQGSWIFPGTKFWDHGEYIAGQISVAFQTIAGNGGTVDINFDLGRLVHINMTANTTFTLTNLVDGSTIELHMVQDGTGGRTAAWPGSAKFVGADGTLSVAAGARDVYRATYEAASGNLYFHTVKKGF